MWSNTSLETVEEILTDDAPVLIFKHSYRCSISSMALGRIEKIKDIIDAKTTFILVDVINQRDLSQKIEKKLAITHASPQLIFVKNNIVQFVDSHMNIKASKVLDHL